MTVSRIMRSRESINAFYRSVALLQMKMRNGNQHYRKDDIIEQLWDSELEPENPLQWVNDQRSSGVSVGMCNLFGMFMLIVATYVALWQVGQVTVKKAADVSRDNSEYALISCIHGGNKSEETVHNATVESIRVLANGLLSAMAQRAEENVTSYMNTMTRRSMETYTFMKDYQVNMASFESQPDWKNFRTIDQPPSHVFTNLLFITAYLSSITKAEKGPQFEQTLGFALYDFMGASRYYVEVVHNFTKENRDERHKGHAVLTKYEDGARSCVSLCIGDRQYSNWGKESVACPNAWKDRCAWSNYSYWSAYDKDNAALAATDSEMADLENPTSQRLVWSAPWLLNDTDIAINQTFAYGRTPNLEYAGRVTRMVSLRPVWQTLQEEVNKILQKTGNQQATADRLDTFMLMVDRKTGRMIASTRALDDISPPLKLGEKRVNATVGLTDESLSKLTRQVLGLMLDLKTFAIVKTFQSFQSDENKKDMFAVARDLPVVIDNPDETDPVTALPPWTLILAMPSDDMNEQTVKGEATQIDKYHKGVLAGIYSMGEQTKNDLGKGLDATNKAFEKQANTMAGMGGALVIVGCVAAILINYCITSPIKQMANVMKEVAYLNLDAADGMKPSSLLEIRSIQLCFIQMVNNLKEFKSFMPDYFNNLAMRQNDEATTIFSDTDDYQGELGMDDDGENGSDDNEINIGNALPPPPLATEKTEEKIEIASENGSDRPARERRRGGGDDRSSVMSGSSHGDRKKRKKGITLALSLLPKKSTCMVVNLEGFNRFVHMSEKKEISTNDIIKIHSDYVSTMIRVIKEKNGVIDRFNGDKIFSSWNTLVTQAQHRTMACHAALECLAAMDELNERLAEQINVSMPPLKVRIGVACGNVLTGNMGCDTLKSFSVVGQPVNIVYVLEKLNKENATSILIESNVAEAAQQFFQIRKVDRIEIRDLTITNEKPVGTDVFELVKANEQAAGEGEDMEWMYRLQAEQAAGAAQWDVLFKAFCNGNLDEADKLVAKLIESEPNSASAARLKERIAEERANPTFTVEKSPVKAVRVI